MIVRCDQEVFEMFPEASVHGIVFDGLATFDPAAVARWKQRAIDSVASSGFTSDAPAVKDWRNTFQRFGVKPSKYRSSIEQLYRRALKQEIIETSLPLVNLNRAIFLADSASHESESRAGDAIALLADAISGATELNRFVLNRANSSATV